MKHTKTFPPKIGPLARKHYSRRQKRWVVKLTDEGQSVVEQFFKDFDGRPIKFFCASFPAFSRFATKTLGQDEVNAICLSTAVRCASRFDPSRGVKFATLFSASIKHEIDYILNGSEISGIKDSNGKTVRKRDFERGFVQPCTTENRKGFDNEFWDNLGLNNNYEETALENKETVKTCLAKMTIREREFLIRYHIRNESLHEIAEDNGITKERVRQIIFNAKEKARKNFEK